MTFTASAWQVLGHLTGHKPQLRTMRETNTHQERNETEATNISYETATSLSCCDASEQRPLEAECSTNLKKTRSVDHL